MYQELVIHERRKTEIRKTLKRAWKTEVFPCSLQVMNTKCFLPRLYKETDKVGRAVNPVVRLRNISKSIGSEYKGNFGFPAGQKIAHSVSHIYRRRKPFLPDEKRESFRLVQSGIAVAEMSGKIFFKSGAFQEYLDVASLTVTDNIKWKFLR